MFLTAVALPGFILQAVLPLHMLFDEKLHLPELSCGEHTLSFLGALLQLTFNHKNLTKAFSLFCSVF